MLGAQALRTKQKVEQKEREKRQKERQQKIDLQREKIQKAANEDSQAAILEYAAQAAVQLATGGASTSSSTGPMSYKLPRVSSASSNALSANEIAHFGMVHALANGNVPTNRRIQQRYSLNANALSNLMTRETQSYDRIQIPHRSSTDYGKIFVGNASSQIGHASGSSNTPAANSELSQTGRFLRWLGFNGSNSKKNQKRRMSTY